ncbi:MAG: glycosyltransferase family 4 protein [Bacteriovoracaceae bacterium]|nr:glycosyltransferase family 4 protein [Bacteriovoracaceae bacterium]
MLLLTTPDYLPKLGGLSSHTQNIEKVLRELKIEYELFVWKNYKDVITFPNEKIQKYSHILNIHSGFHMYMPESSAKVINFVNGAEILFYSPNFFKNVIKKITRKIKVRRVEKAYFNVFISNFTYQTLISKGLRPDYSRDLIFHMAIDISKKEFCPKNWDTGALKFICVARDVPHKNFRGAIKLCEEIQRVTGREVEFITVTDKKFHSSKINIRSYVNPSNELRDNLLKEAHINLLLSLDDSKNGFFEGFGQVVQEAGMFGTPSIVLSTGGLPESVHDNETGWVLNDLSEKSIVALVERLNESSYKKISQNCFNHTIASHGLDNWTKLFRELILS